MSEEELNEAMQYNLDYTEAMLNDELFGTNEVAEVKLLASEKAIKDLQQKVEQLEKENKILKENAEHNDKVVDKVNWENMLLKGKLKDLKERIMLKQLRLINEETYNILHSDLNELLEVLDEEIKYEQ